MANNRAAIRAAVQALLDGETVAESNVYSNRETRLWDSELPAIIIYTNQEPASISSIPLSRYNRTLELIIKIKVKAAEDVDDTLDALCAEVETILAANTSLSGTVQGAYLTNTELSIDSDSDSDIGVAILTYECKYTA